MTDNADDLAGPSPDRNSQRARRLAGYIEKARAATPKLTVQGMLRRTVGLTMEAEGCFAPVGGRCDVMTMDGRHIETEVVGFSGERLFLMSAGEMRETRARMGFIHQDLSLVPNVRVIKNVLAGRLGRQSFWTSLRTMLFPLSAK